MAENNDLLGFFGGMAASVASGVGSAAQGAANAVGEGVSAAAEAVSNAVGGVMGHGPEQEAGMPRLPPKYCAAVQRDWPLIIPKTISVHRVSQGLDGKPTEGREQALRMSKSGVALLASANSFAPAVEKLSISNCCVFMSGKEGCENPVLAVLAALYGCVSAALSPVLALISMVGMMQEHDKWYLYVLQHDGTELLFRLCSESDGNELLEFLDTYMLAPIE